LTGRLWRHHDGDRMSAPRVDVGDDEYAWFERLRGGDLGACEALFVAYYEPLYRYVGRTMGSRADAEEIVQDLFAALWARRAALPVLANRGAVRAYLYRAARNRVVNRGRHVGVVRRLDALDPDADQVPGLATRAAGPHETLVAAERQVAIREAVARLPDRLREVLALRADHGLSYPEIAATLGLSVKTVEGHVTRAFRTLRRSLAHLID
jgi:RNA polymerase sigma-70 factor (ECF subfamily)